MVIEWAVLHREELRQNFAAAIARRPTRKIEPLR
jgi:hypothetical protein